MNTNSLPPIKTLVLQTWEHFLPRWKKLLAIQVVGLVMICLSVGLGVGVLVGVLALIGNNPFESLIGAIPMIIAILALVVAALYFGGWLGAAQLMAITDQADGVKATFKAARPLAWSYLKTTIIMQFLLALLFLLLVVPGVIFAVWWSVAIPVFLLEKQSGWAALKRSKELVTGRWKAVFLRWLVFGGGAILLSMVSSMLSSTFEEATPLLVVLAMVVQVVVSFVVGNLMLIAGFVLYKQLKDTSQE